MKLKTGKKRMKITHKNKNVAVNSKISLRSKSPGRFDQLISLLPFGFNSKPVVAVLRLEGVIGKISSLKSGLTLSALNQNIEKIFKINNLEAVCLCINSPGGSPVQSELIAKRLRDLADEYEVPIYSFVEDVAASGGYWLACVGDKIFASQSSIVGSIGVISSSFGFQAAIEKMGIERRIITEGKSKSVLDPFSPLKESDIKIIKELQKNCHNHFIDHVKNSRKGKLTQSDDILFSGAFWSGQKALDYGLVDGIDDLYSFIKKRYEDDVSIQYIGNKQFWLKKKLGMAKVAEELTDGIINGLENRILSNKFDLK